MSSPGIEDYAHFLPPAWQKKVDLQPESTTWHWRGHDVHVVRRGNAEAPARLILIHGAGGHSAALWPVASLVPAHVASLSAVDLPLYGGTVSPDPASVRYQDWVRLLCDFVAAQDDGRPVVLLGASIGGMLAYEVAARAPGVSAVVATCLLDPREPSVQRVMTRFGRLGVLAGPLARLLPTRLAGIRIPMAWVADLSKMSRDAGLSQLCTKDPRGGGARVPLGFLASFLRYRHAVPEVMNTPVVLAHPARDAWTPVGVSTPWLERIAAPTQVIMLPESGHFPIEDPGLGVLVETVSSVIEHQGE